MPKQKLPQDAWFGLQPNYDMLLAQNEMMDPMMMLSPDDLPEESFAAPQPLPTAPTPFPQARKSASMKDVSGVAAPSPISKSDYDMLVERLNAKGIDSLAMQQQGIDRQMKQADMAAAMPYQTDLSPLMNQLKAYTGNDFGYKAPTSPEARMQMQQQLEGAIQKSRGEMSQAELQLLKSQLGIAQSAQELEVKAAEGEANRRSAEKIAGMRVANTPGVAGKTLPAGVIEKYNDAQMAVGMASGLRGLVSTSADLMGPVKGKAGVMNPYSEDQKKLIAEFDLVRQKIGKMIEGGVLRKEDEAKYARIMPTIEDLPEVAAQKAEKMEAMLKEDIARSMENYGKAGYKVGGFAEETAGYKKDLKDLKEKKLTGEDADAMAWANANPNDPRAKEIKLRLGGG